MAGLTIDYTGSQTPEPGTVPSFANAGLDAILTVKFTPASNAVVVMTLGPAASADGGTWTATFEGETTDPLAVDADRPTIEAALEALSTIGAGNAEVVGTLMPAGAFTVTFVGDLAAQPVGPVTADGSDLTGPDEPYTIDETSHTDGAPTGPKSIVWQD